MKKVININFQGQVIAIEETAYELLKQYIEILKRYFSREDGGDEIVNDIENRIAELFGNRLKLGINCITDEDVHSIISSIGRPEDFDTEYVESDYIGGRSASGHSNTAMGADHSEPATGREGSSHTLYRNSNDKVIAGVCSGLAHYFKLDPVWMRILFVILSSALFWVILFMDYSEIKPLRPMWPKAYRNPNDRILVVCSGIAANLKIETGFPGYLCRATI